MPPSRLSLVLALAVSGWLGGASSASADETCFVEEAVERAGSPQCTGSCRWTDISPASVVRVLSKPGRWHRTFRAVIDGRLLRDGRLVQVYRARPFSRRQVTVDLQVSDGDVYRVSWKKAPVQAPLPDGLVEILTFDGWWEVRPDGNGGSIVSHGARFNPGDDIPSVLIREGMPMQIRRLLRQLRKAVSDE